MQAGSPLAQISQRTAPVAETCPERMQSAKDAGGILAGGAKSRRKARAAFLTLWPSNNLSGKGRADNSGPRPHEGF